MASNAINLFLVVTILLVYNPHYGVYCVINHGCQGLECTLEDLGLDTGINRDLMLQNLTATLSKVLQSPLQIHITHDYNAKL